MITAHDLELRAGARLLMEHASFRVGPGDRVGLVGRNGAGKTTLTRVLSGETQPAAGEVTRSGEVGYLPKDPRTGDLAQLARSSPGAPHRGGGLPASKPGLNAGTHDLLRRVAADGRRLPLVS